METAKDISYDNLSKEELIKRYKKLLEIARKAKESRDESANQLKQCKEAEQGLRKEIDNLQATQKSIKNNEPLQTENVHLKLEVGQLKSTVLERDEQISAIERTLEKLSNKISDYEEKASIEADKLKKLDFSYRNLQTEKECYEQKCKSLEYEIKSADERYSSLESKLKDFHESYKLEKCKQDKLQSVLKELEEKSEKSSTRSESRDGLATVNEAQELESVCQKLDSANEAIKNLKEAHNNLIERSLQYCISFKETSEKALKEYKDLEKQCRELKESSNSEASGKFLEYEQQYKTTIDKLNNELVALRTQLSLDEEQKQISKDVSKRLEDAKSLIEELNQKLTSEQEEKTNYARKLNAEIAELKTQLADYEAKKLELTAVSKQLEEIKATNLQSKVTIDELSQKLQQKIQAEKSLKEQEEQAKNSIKEFDSTIEELTKKLQVEQKLRSDSNVLVQSLEEEISKLKIEKNENAKLQATQLEISEQANLTVEELQTYIEELNQKIEEQKADFENNQRKEITLLQELSKNEKDELNAKLAEKTQQVTLLIQEIETLKEGVQRLTEEINLKADLESNYQKEITSLLDVTKKEKEDLNSKLAEKIQQESLFNQKIEALEQEVQRLTIENTQKADLESNYQKEISSLQELAKTEKEQLNAKLAEHIKQENLLKQEIETLNKESQKFTIENTKQAETIKILKETVKTLQTEYDSANDKLLGLVEKLEDPHREITESCEHCEERKVALEEVRGRIEKLVEDARESKEDWEKKKVEMKGELESWKASDVELVEKLKNVVVNFSVKSADSSSELLTEMNEMNQALRERGETISQLETRIRNEAADHAAKVKELSEKLNCAKEEAVLFGSQVEVREKNIRDLEEEIERLRGTETANETLSTSTISRVEESQRLSELEENFEERYNKLKALAVKLKKKSIELEKQLDQEKAKLAGERNEYQAKLTTLQAQAKTLHTLQTDYDALQEKNEAQRREASERQKTLNKSQEECLKLKQIVEELSREQVVFKQEKATFDMIKKELVAQNANLKKSIEKEQARVKEWGLESEVWEQKLKAAERQLEEEKAKHKQTVKNLEEERYKQKKQSLLDLEMADYDKSVKDMSTKLESKEKQITELLASLETSRKLSETQKASVKELEGRVAAEQALADSVKSQVSALQEEVAALRQELSDKVAQVKEVERTAQERSVQLEAIKIETAQSAADIAKLEEKCRTIQINASNEIMSIEEKHKQLQQTLDRKELELNELRKDFDSYKVRAQSVLRQSQKEERPSRQQDIEEEVIQLRASCDSLRGKLEEAAKTQQLLSGDLAVAKEQKAQLAKEVKRLEDNVIQLNEANSQLVVAEKRSRELREEAARLLPVQQETLAQCYKKEIEELETRHKAELDECKSALQQAEMALQLHVGRQHPSVADTPVSLSAATSAGHRRQPSGTGFVPVKSDREMLDVLMLEREACEGSESVDSASPRIMPLEQLLAPQPPSASVDYSQLIEKLEKSESRIQHLTTLLSDAEGDGARLQQLNQVLKEEIRRKERNVAREEHANNLEYLKNVVIKFATLPRGDERLRLVPVLNTILKLSREEEQRLSAAARGEIGNSGLGSYLAGMWASPQ